MRKLYVPTITADSFGVLSGVASLQAYLMLIRVTLDKVYDPPLVAWIIFLAQCGLVEVGQVGQGASLAVLCLPVLQCLGTFFLVLVLFWHWSGGMSAWDWVAVVCVAAAIYGEWRWPHDAWTLWLTMAVEAVGMLFIARQAFLRPDKASGSIPAWRVFALAGIVDIPAVLPKHSLVLVAYPLIFAAMALVALGAFWLGSQKPSGWIAKHGGTMR